MQERWCLVLHCRFRGNGKADSRRISIDFVAAPVIPGASASVLYCFVPLFHPCGNCASHKEDAFAAFIYPVGLCPFRGSPSDSLESES